jgi:hypothetical protein
MPQIWANLTRHNEAIAWIALGVGSFAAASVLGMILWRVFRRQPGADELERNRRQMIHNKGKIGDGEIVDVDGTMILYTYSVGGVEYTVGQDVSALARLLPEDRMRMVGSASVRYDPKNPPNSIVLCEEWSGLRLRAAPGTSPAKNPIETGTDGPPVHHVIH